MIKRILVALDPDEDTRVATRYATELAKRFEASVSGLAVVDTKKIAEVVGPGGAIGGLYYADKVRERLETETRSTARDLIERFEADLDFAHVPHVEQIREGVPHRRIIDEMKYQDLLVIGRTGRFFYPRPKKKTPTLAHIVKKAIAPTLVVPDEHREVRSALIAYDGSDASARTMQRFAQLQPFGTEMHVELLHVRPWVGSHFQKESEFLLELASAYLKAHGFAYVTETSLEMDQPERRVLSYAQETTADIIVAGAHSVSAMKRVAFGSTTHALLERCRVPFFLYH
jgi:nucleotide-binding universal stress UspA family protein